MNETAHDATTSTAANKPLHAYDVNAILTVNQLAIAIDRDPRTVRRMVKRGELPKPMRFGGQSTWIAGRVRDWIAALADTAARVGAREAARLRVA